MTNYIHRLSTEYRDAGLSVIPLRLDGSKAPTLKSWQPYQQKLATDEELDQWFANEAGIGMVGGAVSGGLEIVDFDDGSLFPPWRKMVAAIVDRLPVVETPSGGWHVLFRCNEIGGNTKIAMDPSRKKQTLIETRGEGGYIAAEGSPCATHATGLPYVQYSGPALPEVPRITPSERRQLWAAARTFDRAELAKEILRKQARQLVMVAPTGVHPVIAAFCLRTTWHDILEPHSWTTNDGITWTRPGKTFGTSARVVTAKDGSDVLTMFSANCGALSPTGSHKSFNKFSAWTALYFRGDNRAAFHAAKQEVAA